MRRADRLFRIVQRMRGRRITKARDLAERFGVSERTIYRDIRDLGLSGVPIIGEAGVGYSLPKGFDLPPLMFNEEELEALILGVRIVRAWADPGLAGAAEHALAKIEQVVPPHLEPRLRDTALFALNFAAAPATFARLGSLRRAVSERRKVRFSYVNAGGHHTTRTVRPLCLVFAAPLWMLTGWCELREEFRNFRLDRMDHLAVLSDTFVDEPGRALPDFFARMNSTRG